MVEPAAPVVEAPAAPATPAPAAPATPAPAAPATPTPVATDEGHVPPTPAPTAAQPAPVATDAAGISLELPEGSPLEAASVDAITAFAEANELSQAQAQAMLDSSNESVLAWQEGEVGRRNDQVALWDQESQTDPEIGGDNYNKTKRLAAQFLGKFGSEGFIKILHDTGYGSHPDVLRTLARAAVLVQEEDTLVKPPVQPPSDKPKTRGERMGYKTTGATQESK